MSEEELKTDWALVWDRRVERFIELARLNAPPIILTHAAIMVAEAYFHGAWRLIGWLLRQRWSWFKADLWWFWHRHILRESDEELEKYF